LILLVLSSVSCGQPKPADCSIASATFHYSRDWSFWNDRLRGVEPPQVHVVRIGKAGGIEWNGTRVTLAMVRRYLSSAAALTPQPFVSIDFERGTRCRDVVAVRSAMNAALACGSSDRCLQGPAPW